MRLPIREPGTITIAIQIGMPSCKNATPAAWMKKRVSIANARTVKTEKLRFPCCIRT